MDLTVRQLRSLIREEIRSVTRRHRLAEVADPEAFDRVYGMIDRLGAGHIPLEDLLALPAWFDAGADPGDARMEAAYRELIKTPVTMDLLDRLATAHGGA